MSANQQIIAANITSITSLTKEIAQARLREAWGARNLEFKKPYSGAKGNFPGEVYFTSPRLQIFEAVPKISSMNIAAADVIESRQYPIFQIIFKTEAALAKFESYVQSLPKVSSEQALTSTVSASAASAINKPPLTSTTMNTSVAPASQANTTQANTIRSMLELQQHIADSQLGKLTSLFPKPNQLISAMLPNPNDNPNINASAATTVTSVTIPINTMPATAALPNVTNMMTTMTNMSGMNMQNPLLTAFSNMQLNAAMTTRPSTESNSASTTGTSPAARLVS